MKNIVFYSILLFIFVHSFALEILQDGPVFKSVETVFKLVKNKTNREYVLSNSTSFLGFLDKIKRELDELSKSQKDGQVLVSKLSKTLENWKNGLQEEAALKFLATRTKRSSSENKNGFSDKIMRMIEDNFPCRDPKTLALIKSGTKYFNEVDCSQCICYMGKLTCEKAIKKCHPNACHLQNGEIVENFAIHNDGCNNCLCYFGELICTHLRCPEAGRHYTNYKSMGLKNVEPEDSLFQPSEVESSTRKPDTCLECDHLTGSSVCALKQWKTFPTLCHAMFCGKNKDQHIDDRGNCEQLNPCAPYPCNEPEQCVPFYQSSCLAHNNASLCQQFKCIPANMSCPKEDSTGATCGEDGISYESECEMLRKGVKLAYKGLCKENCQSEVCGIESRTFTTRCHANEMNAHVDYSGRCEYHVNSALMADNEKGSSFNDGRCEMVYENGRCAPVKCQTAVLPPGSCCPICGSALVISINHRALVSRTYRLKHLHTFLTNNEINARLCKISFDFTYSADILLVIKPYNRLALEACKDLAMAITDLINFERNKDETGIFPLLGAATLVKEKAYEMIDNPVFEDFI